MVLHGGKLWCCVRSSSHRAERRLQPSSLASDPTTHDAQRTTELEGVLATMHVAHVLDCIVQGSSLSRGSALEYRMALLISL
jgi:hypothetical protein